MTEHEHKHAGPVIATVPALAGLAFGAAAAVQFLQADITVGIFGYTFASAHALVVSLTALLVAFASSESPSWSNLQGFEQALVTVAIAIMLSHHFLPVVQTGITNNQPVTGIAAFMSGVIAWGVLAR